MTAGPALVWEGRFQPIHRGHVAYVGELLRRAVSVTVVVVANELSHGRSPVPDFSRMVDAHHAAERNLTSLSESGTTDGLYSGFGPLGHQLPFDLAIASERLSVAREQVRHLSGQDGLERAAARANTQPW